MVVVKKWWQIPLWPTKNEYRFFWFQVETEWSLLSTLKKLSISISLWCCSTCSSGNHISSSKLELKMLYLEKREKGVGSDRLQLRQTFYPSFSEDETLQVRHWAKCTQCQQSLKVDGCFWSISGATYRSFLQQYSKKEYNAALRSFPHCGSSWHFIVADGDTMHKMCNSCRMAVGSGVRWYGGMKWTHLDLMN